MNIAGVLLGAGASTRMGTCKALLCAGGETFLDSLTRTLAEGGCQPVLAVVSAPTRSACADCLPQRARLVVNPEPERGQISSLRLALGELPLADGVVVLLVDQGRVQAQTVSRVRLALGDSPVAVAGYRGRPGHPAGFRREIFSRLESALADGGARAVVAAEERAGRVRFLDLADPGVVRNINTPERYREFLKECGLSPR